LSQLFGEDDHILGSVDGPLGHRYETVNNRFTFELRPRNKRGTRRSETSLCGPLAGLQIFSVTPNMSACK
jgi:hypothetical protein